MFHKTITGYILFMFETGDIRGAAEYPEGSLRDKIDYKMEDSMEQDIGSLVKAMSLEEKAGLCSGKDNWLTKAVERLGIPAIRMADGPHGLRVQIEGGDHLGLTSSEPATCFPPEVSLAASWDRELAARIGAALGIECRAAGVDVLLGPGLNMKRSPLCGRNFEYFSEDPYLAGELGKAYIRALQSKGAGACPKHYAANSQEYERNLVDAVVDERTLRELYLPAFEAAVSSEDPPMVMCAYNKLNGVYCSEHPWLLTEILKREWGHSGIVVSDWGAVNERPDGLAAGLELEMPGGQVEGDKKIVEAVNSGRLPTAVLDAAAERILGIIQKLISAKTEAVSFNPDDHHRLARAALGECIVLLKNEGAILPLKKSDKIGLFGVFAKEPRFQGGGSSYVTPYRIDNALDEMRKLADDPSLVLYADGYRADPAVMRYRDNPGTSLGDEPDEALIAEAVKIAKSVSAALVFAGLPESYESEGSDRTHLRLPEGHRRLIEEVAAVQPNTVVVLTNGAPVEMPWLGKVKGVVEAYLGGQASGGAAADILYGEANPCGKLAETFPVSLRDTPDFLDVPGKSRTVEYREGLFIGYRHYEAKNIEPLFPFGFGLSYTSFAYEEMSLDKKSMDDRDSLTVRIKVRNTGSRGGKEIVQLYVRDMEASVIRPIKELKGFVKVYLEPGEAKTVEINLGKRAFSFWSVQEKRWRVESGIFEILAGPSSARILLRDSVEVICRDEPKFRYTRNSTIAECLRHPRGEELMKALIEGLKRKFVLTEGTGRYRKQLSEMPVRYAVTSYKMGFTEADMEVLLEKLNRGE
ncbi:glycoside hydrolase family 3 C-terminal domain-containing protein [Treponema sp. OttesenSCG-928-L16]|nr:glycoside hydrolase family 3 C-terminal domain-containing protein [Treponema sp. OttesenSCG-928-L16]MDL2229246.1 glycoside hydrolase family 3 C-terminal domain-containing protein [Treponema sp. OttesenSCG-928-L16]